MSNITLLPTAAAVPVVNRRGRLPATVAKLSRARVLKTVSNVEPNCQYRPSPYRVRRDAATELVKQGADRHLFERLENLHTTLADISMVIWEMQNELLFRVDPGLEAAGKAKGG
ncbi:hypothetical protein [Achromobacter marplatensis]|mgnify:CR=1 FL=1